MELINYRKYDDVDVEFAEPYHCVLKTKTGHFFHGDIVNPYAPTVCGIGIVGNKYSTMTDDGKKHCREYQMWKNMITRCYEEKYRYKAPTYFDVTVDPIWFYYENFYEWVNQQENYSYLKGTDYGLDKDILIKGNRIYSPDRCILVPTRVNNLLLKSDAIRGKYPIGVSYSKQNNRYIAACGGKVNHKYLGCFTNEIDAFNAYKTYKEDMIKRVATEEFEKKTITEQCYNALMNYEVEITD